MLHMVFTVFLARFGFGILLLPLIHLSDAVGVGIAQFQHCDQNSPRNLFILGFAIYMVGLLSPFCIIAACAIVIRIRWPTTQSQTHSFYSITSSIFNTWLFIQLTVKGVSYCWAFSQAHCPELKQLIQAPIACLVKHLFALFEPVAQLWLNHWFVQGLSIPYYFTTYTTTNKHGPVNTRSQSFNSELLSFLSPVHGPHWCFPSDGGSWQLPHML